MPVFVFATPATLHEQSLYWGRTDYQDLDWRTSWQGQAADQWPEGVWQGSQSLGKSAELFAGQLTTHGCAAVFPHPPHPQLLDPHPAGRRRLTAAARQMVRRCGGTRRVVPSKTIR